MLFTPVPVV